MKKILFEYANIIAYTVTGLIFGLAFFLIFINFYHYQEVNGVVDVKDYNKRNKDLIVDKINTIKSNINVYEQGTYSGSFNIYGLNNTKIKLQKCVEVLESEEIMNQFDKEQIEMKDVYQFTRLLKNEVLNDCLIMQAMSIFKTDSTVDFPNVNNMENLMDLNVNTISSSVNFVQKSLENADHYYFSTDTNKNNFFNLLNDSYYNSVNNYQATVDLLVVISEWYKNIVIGG